MVKFDVEDDDGDFLGQQPDQGDCSFMSADDDYLDGQSDQGEDAFMSRDVGNSSLHERSSSDQEDDDSAMSDDADSPLHEQSNQEDDGDFFQAFLMGALRTYTERGFYTPAGAGGEDGPDEGTFSDHYYVFNLPRRGVPGLRSRWFPGPTDDDDDADEDDPFPAQAPPAAASEAAVAALEEAEAPADDCCPVCLQDEAAAPGAMWTRVVAPCGHRFHAACVAQWLRVKLSCPVCRRPAGAAAAAPTARRRDDAAEEPSRSRPLPDIVEELLSVGYDESNSSRWTEFRATHRLPSTEDSSGVSAGAA